MGGQFLGKLFQTGGLEVFDSLMNVAGALLMGGVFAVMFAMAADGGQFFLYMTAELFGLFLFALFE